ncbi:MAG: hypothetical protein COU35_04370 [Candidatus Magasanikbacteria bacterium CG10_big_fil_rev_8_21_14_0_10_47_10]|uniref:AcrB/AcrD/AcrF family protein n=1 Tax=Candidatus Magasanikbacteria bacterium CG10_big_fil_rev_8_21_14_0_10_47_10 TaxID=1974652 RepID=A0A2H0TPI9_9BACT|nr:MAG: hypothetical protein COU35_04370 [Candidatus Magasanikbacteria bacterium CG10_big_fil_rev_8_21_14_0_10_47_10]
MDMQGKTIWDFFIDHYRFTFILSTAILLFGLFAIVQLPKESDPEVNIPIVVVATPFPGASPIDVEELVTNPLEDKISGLSDIKSIDSTSRGGVSSVVVEFEAKADREQVIADLKDAVDEAVVDLPEEAKDPIIQEITVSDSAFLQMSLGGPFRTAELTEFANQIKDEIERVSGVSKVQVIGGHEKQIQIVVNKAQLDTFGISIAQVTRAVSSANSDIPIGAIETAGEAFNIRLAGRLENLQDIERVPVASVSGVPVRISDIATVVQGVSEQTSISRMTIDNKTAEPAVTLLMYKQSGGDIVKTSAAVKKTMQQIVDEELPDGVKTLEIIDLAEYVKSDLTSLSRNGIATVVIVFLILFVILGFREAIMAAIAIPFSFLMTFAYLSYIDLTINFMTLFSLILSLGILVDSAIVINEGMNRELKSGLNPFDAAKKVVREYQWPLIAGTLTTVFAFVPMLLTSGIIGQYIKSIPLTVSGVLISSLFVALGLVTTLSAVVATYQRKKRAVDYARPARLARIDVYVEGLQKRYRVFVEGMLLDRKMHKRIIRWTVLMMIISYSLPALGALKVNMFPNSNEPQFAIDFEMPIGTPVERTSELIERIEQQLQQDPRITSYVVNVGQASGAGSTASTGNGHQGYITVKLVEKDRPTSSEFVDTYQKKLDQLQPGIVRVSQGNFGPPSEAPVVVTILGEDLDTLDRLARDFEQLLKTIDGTRNVQSTVEQTNGEFVLHVDRVRAARYGLSTIDVALSLRNAIAGTVATSVNQGGDDVDIVVRTALNSKQQKAAKTDIETIRGLTITTPTGEVPLSSIADITLDNSRARIEHQDSERIAKVTGFTEGKATAIDIFAGIDSRMDEIDIPDGYTIQLGGENEDINQSFTDMFRAMILSVFLIAALLVLQFNSFKQSLIILTTIPLAMIGVFPGLTLLNLPLSFPGIIGIVALVGIVVNNAIILIDRINAAKQEGMSTDAAIADAGESRLKPIIMTTITTVLGILPLALTEEVWRSLGFAIIFGLIFSTFLTLFFVPMLYKRWIQD